ncbi:cyclic GMP-AMP synthase DncV-like nucleotidyltransferase [Paludisphaera mucosa]|uniref:Cyclic GMP-AMP synthase n=1 Tax=Paludisphaera mucosa TaxID=3030827 RepID=A0ABT6FLE9_9BACT|nr:hypothetical protein [Paludisphaera mucosa]MDG3008389.1 hypothetical protein [Paludisphaera mucosa]
MDVEHEAFSRSLDIVIEHLDIPKSLYKKAADRHRSLGVWLLRPESLLAAYDPDVRPQGSFRFGTVNRPLRDGDEYDLDNVCVLKGLGRSTLTQRQLKELYGREIVGYAKAHDMLKPVTEHNRCWRLQYSDEVKFHLDTLPCVPEEPSGQLRVRSLGVAPELALRAVAITDKRDPNYERISPLWPSSNPRGFAVWFEGRAALGRAPAQFAIRASVEDVPPYEWKTTLQRSIQLLKRHRDVMYSDPEVADMAPISMIITNLAARAYEGETDIGLALRNIVEKMPNFINPERPRVPNPADPAEDYADKWARDPRLEKSFWEWHAAVRADIARLPAAVGDGSVKTRVKSAFRVDLTDGEVRRLTSTGSVTVAAVARTAPVLHIPSAPRPWGR